ncbi:DUF6461 domain-containing protein [Halosaccharopolyspora lacisalsi]|uniref:DUF6461 domain-containing protein n=1 Tax=Halosaccharopolyspora lacisalsi TaxID=1000566 RepID=UPI002E28BB0D|nr:DUF6461 domain-containing protein [Halosaccharopolyspora lacisalsi]
MGSDEVERFRWIRSSAVQDAGCLTLVRSPDTAGVAAAFGAVLDRARGWGFDEFCEESFARFEQHSMIAVRSRGNWTLVAEENGFEGSRPEVLCRVSAGTEAVSVFWNVDAETEFNHAVGGEVRTSFEALFPDQRAGTDPDALERIRGDLPWGRVLDGVDTVGLMLALAARVTGRVLTPECFEGEFTTYPVASRDDATGGAR